MLELNCVFRWHQERSVFKTALPAYRMIAIPYCQTAFRYNYCTELYCLPKLSWTVLSKLYTFKKHEIFASSNMVDYGDLKYTFPEVI